MPATPACFLALSPSLEGLRRGDLYELGDDEGRHAVRAARVSVGEVILLTDEEGRRVRCEVSSTGKNALTAQLLEEPGDPLTRHPRLTLVQALATGGRDEQGIESATELGVDEVIPWMARRSVSVWRGEKRVRGPERWRSVTRAAVKQCRRAGVPRICEPLNTVGLAEEVGRRCTAGAIALVLHEQEAQRLMDRAEQIHHAAASASEIMIVVGPEGGIDDDELALLRDHGAQSVLLGPEVLRVSTAGPAAIAVLSSLIGRWG